jgi:hypothetical protein
MPIGAIGNPSWHANGFRGLAGSRSLAELIRTLPALNNDAALSRPRMPEWLDQGIGKEVEDREEQEEIAAGFE